MNDSLYLKAAMIISAYRSEMLIGVSKIIGSWLQVNFIADQARLEGLTDGLGDLVEGTSNDQNSKSVKKCFNQCNPAFLESLSGSVFVGLAGFALSAF